jgi:hypothetical protein
MLAVILASAVATVPQPQDRPTAEECEIIRAAVGAELRSEKHLDTRLRLTAVPNEWIAKVEGPEKADPTPAANLPPLSLASCRLQKMFAGVWKETRSGAINLSLAASEPLLTNDHVGMDDVLVSRATVDEDTGRATVLFGGTCGSNDVVALTRSPNGKWIASAPRQVSFMLCDIIITPGHHKK